MAGNLTNGLVPIGASNRRHTGRSKADRLAMGERILDGRNRGKTMPVLADELGLSLSTAERYLSLVIGLRTPLAVDEFRRQQNDRLDLTQRQVDEQVKLAEDLMAQAMRADPPSVAGVERASALRMQAIALQLRVDERRARLNGLDAPIKVDATVTQVDPMDAELAELLRQAKAKAANEGAQTDA